MTTLKTIESWALHAYVDGELDATERCAIEKLLADDAAARQVVDSYRRQKQALKQAFDGTLSEALPPSMLAALATRGTWKSKPYLHMAAAIALLLFGGLAGWFAGHDPIAAQAQSVAANAIAAHEVYASEVKHPVEVLASEKDHLQAWLSKRVGVAFEIPDLTAEGYTLLGGRLLASASQPAAQLMYEDANKQRITMFLTASNDKSETALRVETKGRLIACYWLDGKLAFAMAGELDQASMMNLARIVYDKFES
jgi:anti-sigma factor RsiW